MPITKQANSHANVKQLTDSDVQSSQQAVNILQAMYTAIVGTSAQVASGLAQYTSLQSAVNYAQTVAAVTGRATIFVLPGTAQITENVSITGNGIVITGNICNIIGNLTLGAEYADVNGLYITGTITLSGNYNFIKGWLASSGSFSNTGSYNVYSIIQD